MGSCSSKPGEVGSMPQEGSGSAAPMDPAAIEAVRATFCGCGFELWQAKHNIKIEAIGTT